MDIKTLDVAVVGAGIAGTAAALCLRQRGARVTVFERAPARGEVGAGLQIGPNGMRVMARLGLDGALAEVAGQPEAVCLRDGLSGRSVARVPMGRRCVARYGQPFLQVHRADLLDLLGRAAEAAGVTFEYGREVAGAADLAADIVVGADGVRSALRARVAPGVTPAFTGQMAWRALIPLDALGVVLSPDTHVFMGPGRHLVAYPLRRGSLWNLVAVREEADWTEEGWSIPDDPDRLRDAFDGWCDAVRALLAPVESVLRWGLFAHAPLASWQDGRVVLAGDACHPMLPFMAQGANAALEDAWVLADQLGRAADVGAALAGYEAARKPRATRIQAASARNAAIYHQRNPVTRSGLHLGLRLASAATPGLLLGRFDWLYGHDVTA